MESGGAEAAGLMLRDGVILLGTAMCFVALFRRLGLGAVLGYLCAGALVGPYGLGLVANADDILHVADLGIVLLLFLVGLELQPSRLLRLRNDILGLGLLQVALAGLALSGLVHLATGYSAGASLAIGLPLALSSTAQVLPSLTSSGEIHTRPGERAFSILLFQDLAIVPLLTIIAALSRADPDPAARAGWLTALYTVGAIVFLVLAGRYLIRPLFHLVGKISERELFVVAGLFTVLASAALMQMLGLSTALGAFVAGVMLADSPYRHELEADVDPFRSILLGLFFVAVGMMLDLGVIASQPIFVISMAAALVTTKALVLYGIARVFGVDGLPAVRLGLLLSQGGEFAFVLFGAAQAARLIEGTDASLFGAIVTLSMATTPFLMMFNKWVERRASHRQAETLDGPEKSEPTRAIVIGYGRFGQTVAQMLMAKGIGVTLIDSNPSQIERVGSFGAKVYYGDGLRIDVLRIAGAAEAQALFLCIDGKDPGRRKVEAILEAFPQTAVFVRAFDRIQLIDLAGLDLAGTSREVFESAVLMGREALIHFGVEPEEAARVEEEYRARDLERLAGQTESGDLHVLKETLFGPDNPLRAPN